MKVCINPNCLNLIINSRFFNFKSRSNNPLINSQNSKFHRTSSIPRIRTLDSFLYSRRTMTMSSSSVHLVNEKILLTDKEKLIFQRLLDVVDHFKLQTQLRVAGGWVRDKLLGKDCYDIDIALDNMLGTEFCEKVNEYFSYTGEEPQRVGIIQSNPEQSKHLETATMRIFDISMDFVNLRSEDYSENSRIPTMVEIDEQSMSSMCRQSWRAYVMEIIPMGKRFGTAKEDAYRRDLTINSLFYNINTSSVEDFTQRGLDDLKKGRIVTPLPANDTFLDDPLRVLRAIRFGARFGFELDEELKEAASCKDVRDAIRDKISRERVGHEIDLMISGTRPVKAMTYIYELHLFWDVFSVPLNCEPSTNEEFDRVCIRSIDATWGLIDSIECCRFTDEEKRLSSYAALFLPLRKSIYKAKKAKEIPVTDYIFRNSLKLKVNDAQAVINIHNASEKFASLIPSIVANNIIVAEMFWAKEIIDVPAISKLRLFTGLLLDEIKSLWRVALLMSTLLYPTSIDCTSDFSNTHSELEKRLKLFINIEEKILKMGLDKIWEVKPLVNGKDIMRGLHVKSGGPLVREWQLKLRQWQLANPTGTAEDCLSQIQSKRSRME